jgi:quercetin dioxygenase-like cupin family protein
MLEWAGRKEVIHAYAVVAPPGKAITVHDHPEDVVLFYPQPDCTVFVEGKEIKPEQGEMLLIPQGAEHWVPENTTEADRVSIAIKVTDE